MIVAKRHLHLSPKDAEELRVKDGQKISVEADSKERSVVFKDVIVRIGPEDFNLAMHVDTDEANAAGLGRDSQGRIVER